MHLISTDKGHYRDLAKSHVNGLSPESDAEPRDLPRKSLFSPLGI